MSGVITHHPSRPPSAVLSCTAGAERLKTTFPSALAPRGVGGIWMLSDLEGRSQAEALLPLAGKAGWQVVSL